MSQSAGHLTRHSASTDLPENRTAEVFISSLRNAQEFSAPYRHWLLSNALPGDVAQAITELPWPPPANRYTDSTREANNATRTYFGVENRARFKICDEVAQTFQSREV